MGEKLAPVAVALIALLAAALPWSAYADDPTASDPAEPSSDLQTDRETIPGIEPGKSLSEQLHEDEGVIDPPPVGDQEIVVPAPDPDPGSTIVIPPPGSPEGDPTVQPK